MPKHLAIDINVISGSVTLTGAKTAIVYYKTVFGNQIVFLKAPRLSITLLDSSVTSPPFKKNDIKSGSNYIGFTIAFNATVTQTIEWIASERA